MEDQLATIKAGSSALLFPATWVVSTAAAGILLGRRAALVTAVLAPASGYAALRAREALDVLIGRGRAILYALSRSYSARRLIEERRGIREDFLKAAGELDLLPAPPPSP
jgi:hypothetical protein